MTICCSVEGCDKRAKGRGLCAAHWKQWRKHGDPLGRVLPPFWTDVEDEVLFPYLEADYEWVPDIRDKLPGRTYPAIVSRAHDLRVRHGLQGHIGFPIEYQGS